MTEARTRLLQYAALTSLFALIALTLSWELWLAPLRPGGSWLALKAVPLLVPLGGIVRGKRYTYKWTTMLILAYFLEGAVRAYTEQGRAANLASVELALAFAYFVLAIAYVRTPCNAGASGKRS
jgi:uncharacterized membrane protein